AEDGIRDGHVTGVQTCALPISGKYFSYAAELLKVNPAHITDEPMIARLRKIGIEPGKPFDIEKLDPAVRNGLASAPKEVQQLMEIGRASCRERGKITEGRVVVK